MSELGVQHGRSGRAALGVGFDSLGLDEVVSFVAATKRKSVAA